MVIRMVSPVTKNTAKKVHKKTIALPFCKTNVFADGAAFMNKKTAAHACARRFD